MKKTIITAMLAIATSLPVLANKAASCEDAAEIAAVVMKARQAGVSMGRLLEMTESKLAEELVYQAYDVHRFDSDEYQQKAISNFREKWEIACLKNERARKGKGK